MVETLALSDRRPFVVVEGVLLGGTPAVVLWLHDGADEILVWDDRTSTTGVDAAIATWSADDVAVVDLRCAGRC